MTVYVVKVFLKPSEALGASLDVKDKATGDPLFVAADVAQLLGYVDAQKAVQMHCKGVTKMGTPTPGGIQDLTLIPERDVSRLVIRSKLKWLGYEALGSILF